LGKLEAYSGMPIIPVWPENWVNEQVESRVRETMCSSGENKDTEIRL
jgi:hypothetical protein